ncbi:hypothetical protein G9A89_003986 [Geosiphon pyriformis]|nr:hypothetical protein G9A89_003986 [Geosiphon pyriformis]
MISSLNNHLASLEYSLELLTDWVSAIVKKLSFVELVSLVLSSFVLFFSVSKSSILGLKSNMALDGAPVPLIIPLSVVNDVALSSSSFKVQTNKIDGLEMKMISSEDGLVWKFAMCNVQSINVFVKQMDIVHWYVNSDSFVSFVTKTKLWSSVKPWIGNKFKNVHVFTSGLDKGFFGTGVAIIMNDLLVCHVFKMEEIPGQIILALEVNSLIAKTINSSTFVVLGGDFNENSFGNMFEVDYFVKIWSILDDAKAHDFANLMCLKVKSVVVFKHLSLTCKEYRKSKIHESKLAKETSIKKVITIHMENFCSNKGSMIHNVLEQLFYKVVLNHLVVNDELVLELKEMLSSVNRVMKDWTKKCTVSLMLPNLWAH